MKKGITPKNFAIRINSSKEKFKEIYTIEDLKKIFKECKLPASYNYIQKYINHGIILRIHKNGYKFPESPIYVGVIEKVLNELKEDRKKSKEIKVIQPIGEPNEEDKIQRCIDYLKSKGFLILRQV